MEFLFILQLSLIFFSQVQLSCALKAFKEVEAKPQIWNKIYNSTMELKLFRDQPQYFTFQNFTSTFEIELILKNKQSDNAQDICKIFHTTLYSNFSSNILDLHPKYYDPKTDLPLKYNSFPEIASFIALGNYIYVIDTFLDVFVIQKITNNNINIQNQLVVVSTGSLQSFREFQNPDDQIYIKVYYEEKPNYFDYLPKEIAIFVIFPNQTISFSGSEIEQVDVKAIDNKEWFQVSIVNAVIIYKNMMFVAAGSDGLIVYQIDPVSFNLKFIIQQGYPELQLYLFYASDIAVQKEKNQIYLLNRVDGLIYFNFKIEPNNFTISLEEHFLLPIHGGQFFDFLGDKTFVIVAINVQIYFAQQFNVDFEKKEFHRQEKTLLPGSNLRGIVLNRNYGLFQSSGVSKVFFHSIDSGLQDSNKAFQDHNDILYITQLLDFNLYSNEVIYSDRVKGDKLDQNYDYLIGAGFRNIFINSLSIQKPTMVCLVDGTNYDENIEMYEYQLNIKSMECPNKIGADSNIGCKLSYPINIQIEKIYFDSSAAGQVAGIVIGVLIIIFCVIAGFVFWYRNTRQRKEELYVEIDNSKKQIQDTNNQLAIMEMQGNKGQDKSVSVMKSHLGKKESTYKIRAPAPLNVQEIQQKQVRQRKKLNLDLQESNGDKNIQENQESRAIQDSQNSKSDDSPNKNYVIEEIQNNASKRAEDKDQEEEKISNDNFEDNEQQIHQYNDDDHHESNNNNINQNDLDRERDDQIGENQDNLQNVNEDPIFDI